MKTKCYSPCLPVMNDKPNNSVGRNKMSDSVTTGDDPHSEYGEAGMEPASFSDADGVVEGLSRRTPLDYRSDYRDSLGVNSKSRGKYSDGSD